MRKQDKYKNITEANLMLENSYLKSKGLINEEEMSFKDYANKIAQQHQLILYPNKADKPELAKLYSNAKGDFKGKQGVIAFDPQTSVISLLSFDFAAEKSYRDDSIPGYHDGAHFQKALQAFIQDHYRQTVQLNAEVTSIVVLVGDDPAVE